MVIEIKIVIIIKFIKIVLLNSFTFIIGFTRRQQYYLNIHSGWNLLITGRIFMNISETGPRSSSLIDFHLNFWNYLLSWQVSNHTFE